jgi:hypothetical protein
LIFQSSNCCCDAVVGFQDFFLFDFFLAGPPKANICSSLASEFDLAAFLTDSPALLGVCWTALPPSIKSQSGFACERNIKQLCYFVYI